MLLIFGVSPISADESKEANFKIDGMSIRIWEFGDTLPKHMTVEKDGLKFKIIISDSKLPVFTATGEKSKNSHRPNWIISAEKICDDGIDYVFLPVRYEKIWSEMITSSLFLNINKVWNNPSIEDILDDKEIENLKSGIELISSGKYKPSVYYQSDGYRGYIGVLDFAGGVAEAFTINKTDIRIITNTNNDLFFIFALNPSQEYDKSFWILKLCENGDILVNHCDGRYEDFRKTGFGLKAILKAELEKLVKEGQIPNNLKPIIIESLIRLEKNGEIQGRRNLEGEDWKNIF